MNGRFPTSDTSPAPRAPSPLLYPVLLAAGIGVIIASLLGIAVITGLLPQARSESASARDDNRVQSPSRTAALPASPPSRPAATDRRSAAAPCTTCGVVESIRLIEVPGEGSGLGAVAGGVVGGLLGNQVGGGRGRTAMTVVGAGAGAYAGHEIEKNMKRGASHEIRVRMDDRSLRTFHSDQPGVAVGQRVNVRDGRLVAAG